ncbi:MAG: hypothetical protein Q9183_006857, partial [Haloplaca sp. 2 TL-2023]
MRPASTLRSFGDNQTSRRDNGSHTQSPQDQNDLIERLVDFSDLQTPSSTDPIHQGLPMQSHHHQSDIAQMSDLHLPASPSPFEGLPVDPQIMHTHQSHQQQHHQHPESPSHQSFEDQLRHATHAPSEGEDAHYGLDHLTSHHDDDGGD